MTQFRENLRTDGRTDGKDGRTDGQTLFHRTLPAETGVLIRLPNIHGQASHDNTYYDQVTKVTQKLWVEWSLSPVRSQWQIHFAVLTLAATWIFFSMMRLGYVTYNVYLHYSSDTENISLKFSFLKIRCPSYTFNFTYFFLCILHIKESCDCSLVECFF